MQRISFAPICLFAYRRPKHLISVLEALAICEFADRTKLYIFIDFPKSNQHYVDYREVVLVAQNFKWPYHKEIILREYNYGLAQNITCGIREVLSEHETVIVVEDDIVVARSFLKYMNEALSLYRENLNVMHIGGYVPPLTFRKALPKTFFSRFMNCWGWATWRNRWTKYNGNTKELIEALEEAKDKKLFNFHDAYNVKDQLYQNFDGKINTWAIKWYTSIFLCGGLCLYPKNSLVKNIGFDGSGEHFHETVENEKNGFDSDLYDIDLMKRRVKESWISRTLFGMYYGMGTSRSILYLLYFLLRRTLKNGRP